MILAEDLRKAVLQAAIQGKLVEQHLEEGTGEELYAQIQTEKAGLIKRGIAKKEKPLPNISEDDIPFDIPDSWKWVRFQDVALSSSTGPFGTMLHKDEYVIGGVPLINPINLVDGKIVPDNKVTVSNETADRLKSYKLSANDLVLARRGEMGRCAIVSQNEEGWLCGTGSFFVRMSEEIYKPYIYVLFQTPYVRKRLSGDSVGTTMGNLNQKILSTMIIPLPPKEEQKRIVQVLTEILNLIKDYSVSEEELAFLQSAFPDEMRKSILQYAMQGKLVEQRPEEGTGEELYRQIQAEKDVLIKESKIKREKPLPEITDEEIPFDIPDNWMWVRFKDLGETTGTDSFCDGPFGSNLKTVHYIDEPEVRIIQLSNIGEYGWRNDNVKYTSHKHLDEEIPRCEVFPGNLVIAKMMPAGRTIEVPDLGTRITLGSDAMKFVPHHLLNKQFLIWYMRSNAFLSQIYADVHGITRVRTTLKKIKTYLVPVPPLGEQKRIVEKLEKILPHIEGIKEAT